MSAIGYKSLLLAAGGGRFSAVSRSVPSGGGDEVATVSNLSPVAMKSNKSLQFRPFLTGPRRTAARQTSPKPPQGHDRPIT